MQPGWGKASTETPLHPCAHTPVLSTFLLLFLPVALPCWGSWLGQGTQGSQTLVEPTCPSWVLPSPAQETAEPALDPKPRSCHPALHAVRFGFQFFLL